MFDGKRRENSVVFIERVFEQSKNLFDTRYERRSLKLKTLLIEAAAAAGNCYGNVFLKPHASQEV